MTTRGEVVSQVSKVFAYGHRVCIKGKKAVSRLQIGVATVEARGSNKGVCP